MNKDKLEQELIAYKQAEEEAKEIIAELEAEVISISTDLCRAEEHIELLNKCLDIKEELNRTLRDRNSELKNLLRCKEK